MLSNQVKLEEAEKGITIPSPIITQPKTRILREYKHLRVCDVKGCGNRAKINPHLAFHKLPKPKTNKVTVYNSFNQPEEIDRLDAWKKALKMTNVKADTRICSMHFTKDDYILPGMPK